MDAVVLITTVRPELLIWVLAISLFVSLAATAIISPGRRWFELAVVFVICFLINTGLVGVAVHLTTDVDVVHIETIRTLEPGGLTPD